MAGLRSRQTVLSNLPWDGGEREGDQKSGGGGGDEEKLNCFSDFSHSYVPPTRLNLSSTTGGCSTEFPYLCRGVVFMEKFESPDLFIDGNCY